MKHSIRRLFPAFLVLVVVAATPVWSDSCDADLCVGPGQRYSMPSEAARDARDGQTVGIMPGSYEDCAVWKASVTIRGISERPHIHDKICRRKAVWITQGAHIEIDNVEISGGRIPGDVGNAIRHEGGTLILRDVVIHDNQVGIMTTHKEDMVLEVHDSHIYGQRAGRRLAHGIYAGRIARFVAIGNYFDDGRSGHFIKTVARENNIAYNQIIDDHGTDTHLIDIWACSSTVVLGNVLVKTGESGNLNFVGLTPRRQRGEFLPCPDAAQKTAVISYNTAVFTGSQPRWSTLVQHRHLTDVPWEVTNNLAVHVGRVTHSTGASDERSPAGQVDGNVHHRTPMPDLFRDPGKGDYRPRAAVPGAVESTVVPDLEFSLPRGTQPRQKTDDVGAHAYAS